MILLICTYLWSFIKITLNQIFFALKRISKSFHVCKVASAEKLSIPLNCTIFGQTKLLHNLQEYLEFQFTFRSLIFL